MMMPADVVRTLTGCFICRRNPIVALGQVLPADDATYSALMKLREKPVGAGEMPTLWYGLCASHAEDMQRSAARVQAAILAAAQPVEAR